MPVNLKDQIVLVVGASSGIGRETAILFAKEGARGVVCADLNESDAKSVAAGVGGLGLRCDVGQEGDMNALVVAALEKYGAVDIFCSNDEKKLKFSATLFACVSPAGAVFHRLLDKYFQGERDRKTLRLR